VLGRPEIWRLRPGTCGQRGALAVRLWISKARLSLLWYRSASGTLRGRRRRRR
jgi:hypothetical protein